MARKILIAAWHVLSLQEPFKASRPRDATVTANSRFVLAEVRPN